MSKYSRVLSLLPISLLLISAVTSSYGALPSLYKLSSQKHIVETARDHNWSVNFQRSNVVDKVNIIALRVEFVKDSSKLTTGDGTFGMNDVNERKMYETDTIYKFDNLHHDSAYFAAQLDMATNYFKKVSRGNVNFNYSIYPGTNEQTGYTLPHQMTYYSPGVKGKKETYDDYNYRKIQGLTFFVRDAIVAASEKDPSIFDSLKQMPDGSIIDKKGRKTVFLIFHAGASYMTDYEYNSPSDMIDVFINREWFSYMKDTLKLTEPGIRIKTHDTTLLIDEFMMCSETANQDQVNWGIQGLLVNQMARQLGIPDLYSASTPGVGAFCIMDVGGAAAGSGFIPPYPSAWVRAFMGWDKIKVASIGDLSSYSVKALTATLDKDSLSAVKDDTTMVLVPLNDHEYYLIENRQRNLTGDKELFKYDTTDDKKVVISDFPFNVNLERAITATEDDSRVPQKVGNNDISLPASGALVWHIDEEIIRQRLANNMVNSDSVYRGISLVEADGITDIGITFKDVLANSVYDYGGAEDVFPHVTKKKEGEFTIDSISPYTKPSSRSNDGGQTYLKVRISSNNKVGEESYYIRGSYVVNNIVDTNFNIAVAWDYLVPNWPKRAAPGSFYDPVTCDLDKKHTGNELVLLSKTGLLYAWSADSASVRYGTQKRTIDRLNLWGDTIHNVDTIFIIDSLPETVASPSVVNSSVFIPSKNKNVYIVKSLDSTTIDSITLTSAPATYVCVYRDSSWALGCNDGVVQFGSGTTITGKVQLKDNSPVDAVASLRGEQTVVVIQKNGTLSICKDGNATADTSIKIAKGIEPYTLVTGDLDHDSTTEIIISDSRHGIWVYKRDLSIAPGWSSEPNDWAGFYHEGNIGDDRSKLPINKSPFALADINRDGRLDIVAGGTNGVYALNYKGALISGWPAYLDNKYWYQRGSVVSSPIVITGQTRTPTVLFSSPTGENATYGVTKLLDADPVKGIIRFKWQDGTVDSIWGLSRSFIDSTVKYNDSLIAPYLLPGGFVDAIGPDAKRPLALKSNLPKEAGPEMQSSWPISTGSPLTTSPMAAYMSSKSKVDLVAVSSSGWIYRWQLPPAIMPDSLFWPMVGYDAGRSFAYGGASLENLISEKDPITFHNYPNPTNGNRNTVFKYKFSGMASKVRLDIYTYTGFLVYSNDKMGIGPDKLTGSYPDWNELVVNISNFGPGLYRCRLAAKVNGKMYSKFWKMAVVR